MDLLVLLSGAKRGAMRPVEAPPNGQGELSMRHRGNSHLLCRVPRLIARQSCSAQKKSPALGWASLGRNSPRTTLLNAPGRTTGYV